MVQTAALAVMTCKRATRDSCRGGVAVSSSSSGGRGRDTSRQDNTALQDSTASTALQDTANQDSTGVSFVGQMNGFQRFCMQNNMVV